MLRIKARIETPTGHKDLVRIEEVTIVLGDEALAEIAKVVASQQGFAPDAACACAEPKPELRYFDVLLCSVCKSPRR